jgi:hypothetical protein
MNHLASYLKTVGIVGALTLAALAAIWVAVQSPIPHGELHAMLIVGLAALAGFLGLVAVGGLVCIWRDRREQAGKPDVYFQASTRTIRPALRWILGSRRFLPGDAVMVRPLDEIKRTLDEDGCLDGLPFMREMEALCGRTFTVHKRIDKINDMRHKTGLRRMKSAVTLEASRCNGSSHGNCEAGCLLIWKDAWLQRVEPRQPAPVTPPPPSRASSPMSAVAADLPRSFVCQMTRLWEASTPYSPWDVRQEILPFVYGNVTLSGALVAMLTRLFNWAQDLRGGVKYPYMPAGRTSGRTPTSQANLQPGELVTVRSKQEIAESLVDGRNRGLWFDTDMVRFAGQQFRVQERIHQVIHESTGEMVFMKTPCIVLKDVAATGEFLRMCPQHEYIFWREIWLDRIPECATSDRPAAEESVQ